jgi:hypothetical protein
MVLNGEAALLTLYEYDFVEGEARLKPRGYDQLAKISRLMTVNPALLVVERTPEAPGLAEARRLVVLNELARSRFVVPPERVVVGQPIANGLSGVEAAINYGNLLFRVRDEGRQAILLPGTVSGGGAFGGAAGVLGGLLGGAGGGIGGGVGGGAAPDIQ